MASVDTRLSHCKDSVCHGFTALYGAAAHISFLESQGSAP